MIVLEDRQDREALEEHRRTFGDWLARSRGAVGLTQPGAAKIAGVSRIQWARWEGGVGLPRRINIAGIAQAVGKDPNEVYHRAGYLPPDMQVENIEYRPTLINDPDAQQPGDPVLDVVWDRLTPDQRTDELRRLARLAREPALPGVSGGLSQDDRDSGFEGLNEADECARLLSGMTAADRESALGYLRYLREKGRG